MSYVRHVATRDYQDSWDFLQYNYIGLLEYCAVMSELTDAASRLR